MSNPSIAETVPLTETVEVRYVLWRTRISGGYFQEAAGDLDLIKRELAAEVRYAREQGDDEAVASTLARYRVVRETVTVAREEVPTDVAWVA